MLMGVVKRRSHAHQLTWNLYRKFYLRKTRLCHKKIKKLMNYKYKNNTNYNNNINVHWLSEFSVSVINHTHM